MITARKYLLDTAGDGCLCLYVQRLDLLNEGLLPLTLQTQRGEEEPGCLLDMEYGECVPVCFNCIYTTCGAFRRCWETQVGEVHTTICCDL